MALVTVLLIIIMALVKGPPPRHATDIGFPAREQVIHSNNHPPPGPQQDTKRRTEDTTFLWHTSQLIGRGTAWLHFYHQQRQEELQRLQRLQRIQRRQRRQQVPIDSSRGSGISFVDKQGKWQDINPFSCHQCAIPSVFDNADELRNHVIGCHGYDPRPGSYIELFVALSATLSLVLAALFLCLLGLHPVLEALWMDLR